MTPQERLKELRRHEGLSQKEFAERLRMKQTSIAGIETGGRNISPRVLALLEMEFRANSDWILSGKEPMYLPETEEESFDRMIERAGVSDAEKAILRTFISLPLDVRLGFVRFIEAAHTQLVELRKLPGQPDPDLTTSELTLEHQTRT